MLSLLIKLLFTFFSDGYSKKDQDEGTLQRKVIGNHRNLPFNDEEKEQQDVIIKKVTSLTMKKVTTSTMKKVSSSTMKKNTISSHKRIEKVQQRLKERNRSWRRKRIIYT